MRKPFAVLFSVSVTFLCLALATAAPQDKGPAPAQAKGKGGRGGRPAGPPGPVPRLSDGKPDLSGVWNGQQNVAGDGRCCLGGPRFGRWSPSDVAMGAKGGRGQSRRI